MFTMFSRMDDIFPFFFFYHNHQAVTTYEIFFMEKYKIELTFDHKDSSSANNSQAFLCFVLLISRAAIEIKPTLAHPGDL